MSAPPDDASRSRTAPRAVGSSDVSRFHGVVAASAAAGITVIVLVAIALGADGLRSPGPLSPAHARASRAADPSQGGEPLACASCHDAPEPAAACVTCHGAHGSVRAGHAALAARGDLRCTSCHRAHGGHGLAFAPDGTVTPWIGGDEAATTSYRPLRDVHVPLIAAAACADCHDLRAPSDPIAICLPSGASERGDVASTPIVCFDEHRRGDTTALGASGGSGGPVARDAAWDAAREVLASGVLPASGSRGSGAWLTVLLPTLGAVLLGLVVLVVVRRLRRRPVAPVRAVVMPVVMDKVRLPRIDTNTCLGCHACVDACPYDVLAMERYVAVVVRPKDCCGLTLCEQVCPNGSLTITDGAVIEDRPNVSASLESLDQPGLYLAGDLTGAPLIRNAIRQGSLAVRSIAEGARGSRGGALDVVIVGAGPAGISAALEAKAQGLRYEVFEQGSVAESIRSFPRGKLVFDQPVSMPLAGDLWLEESTKEELLAKWLRIVHRERLVIREGHRVGAVEPPSTPGGPFTVRATSPLGEELTATAARVVLALGRRGTPRKLAVEIPDGALDRVHYSLADARSHAGAQVVVAGLGDVAMEAAIALARQPSTRVTVVYRGEGFSRGKARNVSEVERLVRDGRIELLFEATVRAVGAREITLGLPAGERRVGFDALFVMIGSRAPWPFLEAAGVKRVSSA